METVKLEKMSVLCASGDPVNVFDETIETIGGQGIPGAIAE